MLWNCISAEFRSYTLMHRLINEDVIFISFSHEEKIMYAVKQLKLVTQNVASHLFQSYLSIALIYS